MQLVIVRRSQFFAFGLLSQAFAGESDVRLIWDRRVQVRRGEVASQRIEERRSRDRRRDPLSSWGNRRYMVIARRADGITIDIQQQSVTSARALAAVRMAGPDVQQDLEAAARSDLNVLITAVTRSAESSWPAGFTGTAIGRIARSSSWTARPRLKCSASPQPNCRANAFPKSTSVAQARNTRASEGRC